MTDNLENQTQENPEYELNHTDKLVGVFTEPGNTFKSISHFKLKTSDWIIPLLIVFVLSIVSSFLLMTNPDIKIQYEQKAMEEVETSLQQQIEKGDLNETQADQAREMSRKFIVIGFYVFKPVGTLIMFFVVALILFLILKFGLKGEGTYGTALVATGLPQYITAISSIVAVIAALAMDKFIMAPSIGAFIGADEKTFVGFLLHMIDIFFIWYLFVVATATIHLFKAKTPRNYYIVIFGIWIVVSLFFFAVS